MGRLSIRLASYVSLGAALAVPFALGCRPLAADDETEELGTFVVRAALAENGCAPGLSPIDPLEFRVTISRTRNSLTWRIPGGAPAFGSLRSNGELRIQRSIPIEAWPADPDQGIVGCSLSQVETIEGQLTRDLVDAGPMASAELEGTHRIEVVPASGSDCSALLLIQGGEFPSLPCAARYDFVGGAD